MDPPIARTRAFRAGDRFNGAAIRHWSAFPLAKRSTFSTMACAVPMRFSAVTPPMCGSTTTFGCASSGSSGRAGSWAMTSRPAPESEPSSSAAISACSSISAPRATLTRKAPRLTRREPRRGEKRLVARRGAEDRRRRPGERRRRAHPVRRPSRCRGAAVLGMRAHRRDVHAERCESGGGRDAESAESDEHDAAPREHVRHGHRVRALTQGRPRGLDVAGERDREHDGDLRDRLRVAGHRTRHVRDGDAALRARGEIDRVEPDTHLLHEPCVRRIQERRVDR